MVKRRVRNNQNITYIMPRKIRMVEEEVEEEVEDKHIHPYVMGKTR